MQKVPCLFVFMNNFCGVSLVHAVAKQRPVLVLLHLHELLVCKLILNLFTKDKAT